MKDQDETFRELVADHQTLLKVREAWDRIMDTGGHWDVPHWNFIMKAQHVREMQELLAAAEEEDE